MPFSAQKSKGWDKICILLVVTNVILVWPWTTFYVWRLTWKHLWNISVSLSKNWILWFIFIYHRYPVHQWIQTIIISCFVSAMLSNLITELFTLLESGMLLIWAFERSCTVSKSLWASPGLSFVSWNYLLGFIFQLVLVMNSSFWKNDEKMA